MNINEVLSGNVGSIDAHPDDSITKIHGIRAARRAGGRVFNLVYNKGRGSTLNYRADEHPPFSVTNGDRESENRAAAVVFGMAASEVWDATDGGLQLEIAALVPATVKWIEDNQINTLLTIGGLDDHPDHLASGRIALQAAQQAYRDGWPVDVLELQMGTNGDVIIGATPDGMEQAFAAARQHGSQFQMGEVGEHPDWPIVPGGLAMHPDSFADLRRYPILRDSTYVYYPAGSLMVAQATGIVHVGG